MTHTPASRIALLESSPELLSRTLRGIEKEGLRVDARGALATTAHPAALGPALTNERITTDYSEALLELITGTHADIGTMLTELEHTHRFVYASLKNEIIWNHSMPATLPSEADIPIARYGDSNSGRLKHVYRRGLAVRYGKAMQCIAGVHYNFSLDDAVWELIGSSGQDAAERRSNGYMALIRNFQRYSWLLMYLFGATPAVSTSFMASQPASGLVALDPHTLYAPYATSLRMSDLGYQNKAQSQLKLGYNDLRQFLAQLHQAVTQPWPAYEAIGTHRNGEWVQLNTHVLQIENEYYSTIRPKRSTGRCERPITAMNARGVQYVEVRCLDIDPSQAVGIHGDTARFVDAFLLFCATEASPLNPDGGYSAVNTRNFATVVKNGRLPGLELEKDGQHVKMAQWGRELLDRIEPYAALFDRSAGGASYAAALAAQREKIANPDCTPSARLLDSLRRSGASFHEHALAQSKAHAQTLKDGPLPAPIQTQYEAIVRQSVLAEKQLVASDSESFDEYVARYERALTAPARLTEL